MPNIREYTSQGADIRPTETGIEATAAAARRVSGAYNEASADMIATGKRFSGAIREAGDVVVKYAEHQEVSNGSKNFAKLQDDLTKQWNETAKNADPSDPTTAAKFREEVLEPRLQSFDDTFNTEGGQRWSQSQVASLRNHMVIKTSADMSTMASQATAINAATTVNKLSSTVREDPSSLDFALKTAESSFSAMADSSPNLSPADAAKLKTGLTLHAKEQIVKSWFMGVAEKSPETAVKALEGGKYADYIKGDEAKTIIGYARTNARLLKSEANNARVMQDHVNKSEFNQRINELELSTVPNEVGDRPTLPKDYWQQIRKIGQMPGAAQEPGRLRTMINNGEIITARLEKPEPLGPVSHGTTMDLLKRMRATDTTRLDSNDEIYKAYGEGKLNTADFNFLNKEYATMKTPQGELLSKDRTDFFKQYTGAIAGTTFDPVLGSPKLYTAEMDARRQEEDMRKKGLDPHLVYDPRSEYFFGKPSNIAKYQVPMDQLVRDRAAAPRNTNLTAPGNTVTGIEVKEASPKPPAGAPEDAKLAPDGNWYVARDGKYFRYETRKATVPMSK